MELELGFRAFDPHELLPHAIASRLGLYADAGVAVRLVDLTFAPEAGAQVSCGSALLARLGGADLRIALVASRRPLFWLYARGGQPEHGLRVAAYPEGSPPALFARMLLPDAELVPARDTETRIGLLLANDVDAAIVSTASPPAALEALGLHPVLAFADHLTLPTTGLAAPTPLLERADVAAAAAALRGALGVIQDDRDEVARALVDAFRYDQASAELRALSFTAWFSSDGTIAAEEAASAVETLAHTIGTEAPPAGEVFAPTALRRGS